MEGTKEEFFAQYWGQYVLVAPDKFVQTVGIDAFSLDQVKSLNQSYLELTDINDITDEDAMKLEWCISAFEFKGNIKHFPSMLHKWKDDLRSMGYAVGWRQYSVQDLVTLNWIKLK